MPDSFTFVPLSVLRNSELTFSTKIVLCWLARRVDPDEPTQPVRFSCKRAARHFNMSVPTVSSAIDSLEANGFISVDWLEHTYALLVHKDTWLTRFIKIPDDWLDCMSLSEAVVLSFIRMMAKGRGNNNKWCQNNKHLEKELGMSKATICRRVAGLIKKDLLQFSSFDKKLKKGVYLVFAPEDLSTKDVKSGKVLPLRRKSQ